MDLDRGVLSRIDRKLLAGLGQDETYRMVRVPVTAAKWSTWSAVRYSAETVGLLLRMDGFAVQHVGRDNEVACGTADEPLGDDSPLAFGRRLDEATGLHRPQVVVHVLAG